MATGTNGIATVNDLITGKNLDYPSSYAGNQCPTKSVIESMGGSVPSTYGSNQLVKYSDVYKAVSEYTLTLNTSLSYSALILFTASGAPYGSLYDYEQINNYGGNVYKVTFTPGSGLEVNDPLSIDGVSTVYDGLKYRVWGMRSVGSSWTLVATLTHVDGDKTEYI